MHTHVPPHPTSATVLIDAPPKSIAEKFNLPVGLVAATWALTLGRESADDLHPQPHSTSGADVPKQRSRQPLSTPVDFKEVLLALSKINLAPPATQTTSPAAAPVTTTTTTGTAQAAARLPPPATATASSLAAAVPSAPAPPHHHDATCGFAPTRTHAQVALSCRNHLAVKTGTGLYRTALAQNHIDTASTTHPIYFEFHFLNQEQVGGICVGLATTDLKLDKMVGTTSTSLGFYSSGNIVADNKWTPFGNPFSVGDTVGCLVRVEHIHHTHTIRVHASFFVNGVAIGDTSHPLVLDPHKQRLYPAVSLYKTGSKVALRCCPSDMEFANTLSSDAVSLCGLPINRSTTNGRQWD